MAPLQERVVAQVRRMAGCLCSPDELDDIPGVRWQPARFPRGTAEKIYICPFCNNPFRRSTLHYILWPRGRPLTRRHADSLCFIGMAALARALDIPLYLFFCQEQSDMLIRVLREIDASHPQLALAG